MNMKVLGVLVGIFQIIIAFWYFDWRDTSQLFISVLLFLGGSLTILSTSTHEQARKLQKILRPIFYVSVVIFIIRQLFFS